MGRSALPRSTGTKRTASGAKSSRSSASSREQRPHHVVCVENRGYPASLERRKIYVTIADAEAERTGFVRVIDESGADYLYPKRLFAAIRLSPHVARVLAARA